MKGRILTTAIVAILAGMLAISCTEEEGCTDPLAINYDPMAESDDGTCMYDVTPGHSRLTFQFSHDFDGSPVSNATFNLFDYINENGDTLSISRLRYLISDIRFYKANGDSVVIEGYQLIDVTAGTGFTYEPTVEIPHGIYTGVSFIFGFDEADNVENAYPDLNAASWNWPDILGGGYHFMQMEGMYMDDGVAMPYAYHNGTARVSPDVFEQNYIKADLAGVTLSRQFAEIGIEMDVAEWYKNPTTWDLKVYDIALMPNYDAQKMMQANGKSVFSLGEVSQSN